MSDQAFSAQLSYSMNGFRRNLHNSLADLKATVKQIAVDGGVDEDHLDDLMDSVNDLICQSNSVNCVFIADDENFKDMSDVYLVPICEEEDDE